MLRPFREEGDRLPDEKAGPDEQEKDSRPTRGSSSWARRRAASGNRRTAVSRSTRCSTSSRSTRSAPWPSIRGRPTFVWVGTGEGTLRNSISHGDGVNLTRDGGATWNSVEKALPSGAPKNAHVAAIEPSRHDAATAFAVLDNHRWGDFAPYVYRTDDSGKSWKCLVTPTVKGYALAIVQDPVKKDLLFLGTETGLYTSLDGGKTWLHLSKTIPTASVMDLVIHPTEGDLVIATHGRAIWILDDLTPFREMSEEVLGKPLHLFAPVPARQHWRAPEDGATGAGAADAGPLPEWQASGPEVSPGDYTVALTFKDAIASAKVTVLPDPRSKNTAADWATRWAVIERAGELQEKAAEAAIRIRRTRDDVAAVEERLRRRNETLRDPAERRKANETPFAKEAAALKKALTERENVLWSPPEDAGIAARNRVAQELQAAAANVASSWAPPSPTHFERLRQAEARLTKVLADLDAFWEKDVDAFRQKAAKEGVGLLAP